MPTVFDDIDVFRRALDEARTRGGTIGLVPTMGALHDGHLSLVREAKKHASLVATTIFVNPTQFGPNEDLARYPRDLAGDVVKLEGAGCDLVLAPSVAAMYPDGERTRVRVDGLTETLCGPHRPGHFEGVATIVTKLFAIAGPCTAVFGRKDYQQLAVIRRLARDLLLPVRVIGLPTVREKDGLAMSSRNAYLSTSDRLKALSLVTGLRAAATLFAAGERSAAVLRSAARGPVAAVASSIDYVDLADPDSLAVLPDGATAGARVLVAIACRIGQTRLIDNLVLGEDVYPAST